MPKLRLKPTSYLLITIVLLVVVGLSWLVINRSRSPLDKIFSQADFKVLVPRAQVSGLDLESKTLSFSTANSDLTYTVLVNSKPVVVSEQATPQVFSQSGVYDFKLAQANNYSNLTTAAGTVNFTRPSGLEDQTVAWLNTGGTFLIAHALSSLTTKDWQLYFNNLAGS